MVIAALAAGGSWAAWSRYAQDNAESQTAAPADRFQQGLAALKAGRLPEARSAVEALEDIPGFEQETAVLRGGILLNSGDFAAAQREWESVELTPEMRLTTHLIQTGVFYRRNDLARAEQFVYAALRIDSENVDARRWLAAIYYDLGADTAAEAQLQRVASLDPGDYRPHHLLGQINFDAEHYTRSTASLRAALKRNPPPAVALVIKRLLARSLIKNRAYADVLELVGDEPDDAALLAVASEAHWGQGRLDRARQLLRRAEQREPDNRLVLVLKATMAMQAGRPGDAVAPLVRQLKADPFDVECRYRLALCYRKLGRQPDYQREITRMREVQTTIEKLSKLTNQAIERPDDAEIRDRIAELFLKIGKPKLAEVYRRAAAACRQSATPETESKPTSKPDSPTDR